MVMMQLVKIRIEEQLWTWANVPDMLLSEEKSVYQTAGIVSYSIWFQFCKQKCEDILRTEKWQDIYLDLFWWKTFSWLWISLLELLWVVTCGHLVGIKRVTGDLISTCVLEKRWVGWNVWRLGDDGCVCDSDGGCAGSMTHVWVRLAFWFWQGGGGGRSSWRAARTVFFEVHISGDGLFYSTVDIPSRPSLNPLSPSDLQ